VTAHPTQAAPSDWVCRWAPLIPAGGRVLDLACGSGRHVRWLAARGWRVTGIDRDATALGSLRDQGEMIVADLEDGRPWPLANRTFDAVVVTNYLWRPLLGSILAALAPGGVLIYETFGIAQATIGRPSRPEFLLQPGELLALTQGLRTVAYEDGLLHDPTRAVQRLCAVASMQASPRPLRPAPPR
jgi:SAM-dependent methyltransferase